MERTQGLFWIISGSLTAGTVGFALFLAFYGSDIADFFISWKESRRRSPAKMPNERQRAVHRQNPKQPVFSNFEVLDAFRPTQNTGF